MNKINSHKIPLAIKENTPRDSKENKSSDQLYTQYPIFLPLRLTTLKKNETYKRQKHKKNISR
jgi:hypothetical protein